MDFPGCLRGVLPISCPILCLCGASGPTWPALRMGSALFLGVVFVKMVRAFWELAPSVRWELRAGIWSWLVGSQMGLEEVNSDTLRPGLQNSRFFSLALDVKFSLHSFLLALSFFLVCSSFHHRSSCWNPDLVSLMIWWVGKCIRKMSVVAAFTFIS